MAVKSGEVVDPNSMFNMPSQDDETEADLSDVLAELGGMDDAKINIYRAGGAKGMRGGEFVDSIHPVEFSLQWLRDNYGGGEYRVHVRGSGRILANRVVKIAEPLKRDLPAIAPQINPLSGIEKLVETMQTGFMQLGQLIVKSSEVNRAPAVDPMTMQQQTMQMLLTMKQFVEPSQPQGGAADAMNMFLKGLEVAKELKGDFSEREPGSTDILMKAVEAFAPAIATMAANQTPQPQPQQIRAQTMPYNPAPAIPQISQPQTGDAMTSQLQQYSGMLVMLAKNNSDPYAYATLICDSASPEEIGAIINRPDIYTYLASINPDLGDPAIRPWLDEFIAEIKNILTPEQNLSSVGLTSTPQGSDNAFVSSSLGVYSAENPDNGNA